MEAVWKRILLLLIAGVLLTVMLFPIVRGDYIHGKRQPIMGWVSTDIELIYINPKDTSQPPDGKIDIHEERYDEFLFIFRVVVDDQWINHGEPVPYGQVWLNISMGAYTNSSVNWTDIHGFVSFSFDSSLTDSKTGNYFSFHSTDDRANITLEVIFARKEGFTSGYLSIFGTYYREPIKESEAHKDYFICAPIIIIIGLYLLIVIILILLLKIGFISLKERKKLSIEENVNVSISNKYPGER